MILDLEKEYFKAIAETVRVLESGGVLVFPTDTVYGIGGDARSAEAVEKIYKIKGREKGKPLAVIMSGFGMIDEWCDITHEQATALMEHLPGPYTFLLNLRKGKTLAGITGKIGVRVPNYVFLRKVAENFGAPIIATSANISGKKDAVKFSEVEKAIVDAVDLALDGGETSLKKPSTVVDLVEKKILRNGAGEFEFK